MKRNLALLLMMAAIMLTLAACGNEAAQPAVTEPSQAEYAEEQISSNDDTSVSVEETVVPEENQTYHLGETASTDVLDFTLETAALAIALHDGTAGDYNDICMPKEFEVGKDDNSLYVAAMGHTMVGFQFCVTNKDRVETKIADDPIFLSITYGEQEYGWENKAGIYNSDDGFDWHGVDNFAKIEASQTKHFRSAADISVEVESLTDPFLMTFNLPTSSGDTKAFTYSITTEDIAAFENRELTLEDALSHFTFDDGYEYFERHQPEFTKMSTDEILAFVSLGEMQMQLKGNKFSFNQTVTFDGSRIFTYYYKTTEVNIPYSVGSDLLSFTMNGGTEYTCEAWSINDTSCLLTMDGAPFGVLYLES